MNAVAPARTDVRARTLTDRFLAAVPLFGIFLWLCLVYGWEAWRHGSPWLFGDELELTQLSRGIAATGHAARRGQPHAFDSLYTYFLAPAWRIHSVRQAYAAVKDLNFIAMSATIFPTYGLARFVVGRWPAVFAGFAAAIIPAFAYTAMIVEENVAYPYSTLCLFLVVAALVRRTRWWIAGAVVACLIAPLVRAELIVLPALFVLAVLLLAWQSPTVVAWRARWSASDWIGAVVLAVGAGVLVSAILGSYSHEWLIATGFYKGRVFTYGLWAAGALAIGLGVFPVIAGLASLWRAPREAYRRELRVFRCVLLAAVVAFLLYTAVKAAYVSTTFGTSIYERNLIYVAPLLFVGTALWLERRTVNPVAVVVAALATLYIVLTAPYRLDLHFHSDAPGLALLEWLNRSSLGLTTNDAKVLLVAIVVVSVAVLVTPRFVPVAGHALVATAVVFVVAWNLGGELAGAAGSKALSDSFLLNINGDPTWLDKATAGAPTLYLGQQMQDQTGEWLLEFWNRSLKQVWSLDGTAQGPGPVLTPDLHKTDGTLFPDPHYPYLVAERGIQPVGSVVAVHPHRAGGGYEDWTLYRLTPPLRLLSAVTGITGDGWTGPTGSTYTRYSSPNARAGVLKIRVERDWGGPPISSKVTIAIGYITIGRDKEPHIDPNRPARTVSFTIGSRVHRTVTLRAPGPSFRVELSVLPTFVPQKLSPQTTSDRRELGAMVHYQFIGSRRTRT